MYGRMTPEQLEALPSIIQGRHLLDLGSGDLERARLCLAHGAASITCIDPTSPLDCEGTPNLLVIQRYAQWALLDSNRAEIPPYDMVLLGWPNNNDNPSPPYIALSAGVPILYVGKNTDGVACGGPLLWRHLLSREVKRYLPGPRSTLILYGDPGHERGEGARYHEEAGALTELPLDYSEDREPRW